MALCKGTRLSHAPRIGAFLVDTAAVEAALRPGEFQGHCIPALMPSNPRALHAGPIKATHPERAAAKRAARRKDFAKLTRAEGGSILDDISASEAEYDAREGFWANSGFPIEPFHLRQEREAGYFDDEGNYVAFKDDRPEDAWLESLPKGASLQ